MSKQEVIGYFSSAINGGINFELDNGSFAFLPDPDGRQLQAFRARAGQPVRLRIVEADTDEHEFVVALAASAPEKPAKTKRAPAPTDAPVASTPPPPPPPATNIPAVGAVCEVEIAKITPGGCHVRYGNLKGFAVVAEFDWIPTGRHPDTLRAGDRMAMAYLGETQSRKGWQHRFSPRALTPDPWKTLAERFPVGSSFTGRVSRKIDYGVFIDNIDLQVRGLLHVKSTGFDLRAGYAILFCMDVGQEIVATVTSIDPTQRRLGLGYAQSEAESAQIIGKRKVKRVRARAERRIARYQAVTEKESNGLAQGFANMVRRYLGRLRRS